MASTAAQAKAAAIVDAFMGTEFDEEAEAAAWLSKRIAEAIDEAARAGQEAERLHQRRDR
jgi:hypothetical protein